MKSGSMGMCSIEGFCCIECLFSHIRELRKSEGVSSKAMSTMLQLSSCIAGCPMASAAVAACSSSLPTSTDFDQQRAELSSCYLNNSSPRINLLSMHACMSCVLALTAAIEGPQPLGFWTSRYAGA
jgi:hypothetical protein